MSQNEWGDGIIYYSPKLEFEKNIPCQEFIAIGVVSGEEVYLYDMGNGFTPYRRNIRYLSAQPAQIKPLIERLQFIENKKQWGVQVSFWCFRNL